MDEDWDRDQIVDLDVTGDPQLDQFGYQSPRAPGPRPGFKSLPTAGLAGAGQTGLAAAGAQARPAAATQGGGAAAARGAAFAVAPPCTPIPCGSNASARTAARALRRRLVAFRTTGFRARGHRRT
jgi:hypothetical protein